MPQKLATQNQPEKKNEQKPPHISPPLRVNEVAGLTGQAAGLPGVFAGGLLDLYFYDPWPVSGDQLIECSDDLNEIEHYFWNPLEAEEGAEEGEEEGIEISVSRTFSIDAKYTPPAEEGEEAE